LALRDGFLAAGTIHAVNLPGFEKSMTQRAVVAQIQFCVFWDSRGGRYPDAPK
jgi:hypothetical protein